MKNLKKIGGAVVLTCVLGLTAFAGETDTPPCAPGQVNTPPCASAQAPTPGQTDTPPAAALGEIQTPPMAQRDASLTEIAASVLSSILLSLF